MVPEKFIPTLDYATPRRGRVARVLRPIVYVAAIVWSGVLAAAVVPPLLSPVAGWSLLNTFGISLGSVLVAVLLLRELGRAGCVMTFIVFAAFVLFVLWYAVDLPT